MFELASTHKDLSLAIAYVLAFTGSWRTATLLALYCHLLGAAPGTRQAKIVHYYYALRRSCLPIAGGLLLCHFNQWSVPNWLFAIAVVYWCNVFRTISAALSELSDWRKRLEAQDVLQ